MELPVPRVLALGRKREQEIAGCTQAGGFEDRHDLFLGGARIGGGLEDDQLTDPQMAGDVVGRAEDVAEIRLAMPAQGSGEADKDHVTTRELRHIGGGMEVRRPASGSGDALGSDVGYVRTAVVEGLDLGGVDVEGHDREARFTEEQRQRQTDVPLSHNAHSCLMRRDALSQFQQDLLISPWAGPLCLPV